MLAGCGASERRSMTTNGSFNLSGTSSGESTSAPTLTDTIVRAAIPRFLA